MGKKTQNHNYKRKLNGPSSALPNSGIVTPLDANCSVQLGRLVAPYPKRSAPADPAKRPSRLVLPRGAANPRAPPRPQPSTPGAPQPPRTTSGYCSDSSQATPASSARSAAHGDQRETPSAPQELRYSPLLFLRLKKIGLQSCTSICSRCLLGCGSPVRGFGRRARRGYRREARVPRTGPGA